MKRLLLLTWTILCATSVFSHLRPRLLTVADGLPNNQVRQIVELPNHQLFVAVEGAFCLYNGKRFIPLACNLDSIRRLSSFGGEDHLWQGDSLLWLKDFYSLYLFDARTRKFRYDYENHVTTPWLEHFVGEHTDELTVRRSRLLKRFAPLLDSLTQGSELYGESLTDYCRDRQGGQWLGLRNSGVLYLPPQSTRVRVLKISDHDIPRHLTALDGDMMLVAGAKGIYEYDCRRCRFSSALAQGRFNTAESHRDGQGRVWISTHEGLLCYNHGTMERYDSTNVHGFARPFIRFALPVDDRRLLVCNYQHDLGYFYPDERRMEVLNTQLPELDSYRIMIDAAPLSNRNHVAVCTQNGAFVLDIAENRVRQMAAIQQAAHYCRKYNCILLDRTGRLWVGTQNGLLLVDDGKLRRITRSDGLSNQCIQALAEDQNGHVWVATSSGVNRIRMRTGDSGFCIRAVTTDDGLPAVEMLERGICMMPDGNLYLASAVGLVVLPTADFAAPPSPPSLELVGLDVAGKEMQQDTLPLCLNYQQNYIELQLSTLDYAHPNSTRYRYRVLQLEDGWHATTDDGDGRLATIRLSALQPGRYTVEVQASTGDDLWGETFHKTFVIRPPLWLTWWAKLFYVLIGLVAAVGFMSEYLRRKREKLNRENELRVNALFELREEARHQFAQAVEIDPSRLAADTEDQQLVERILKAIGENMSNTDYTVDLLARDVGMSRANLYKKMQATVGCTPNYFMRNVRLKRAAELLAKSDIAVNQLSLMVGFQTPRYFSQCFREVFGVTPSEYRAGRISRSEG